MNEQRDLLEDLNNAVECLRALQARLDQARLMNSEMAPEYRIQMAKLLTVMAGITSRLGAVRL
jgi:hypothetical protein